MPRVAPGNYPLQIRNNNGTLVNYGPGTVYYSDNPSVTTTLNNGSLATGQTTAVGGVMWLTSDAPADVGVLGPPSTFPGSPLGGVTRSTEPADVGLLGWAYDPATATAASAPVAGTMYLVRVPVREPITITNVMLVISTPGTGVQPLVNCFAAIYDSSGIRHGVTADQSAAWASGTTKVMPLVADPGQSLSIGGVDNYCYVAFVAGTQSTTAVQFFRSGSSAAPGALGLTAATTPPARFLAKAGFASGLPTTLTYSTCAVSSILFWAGVS